MKQFLIWSHEHRMWWRANSQGYTPNPNDAGRYAEGEARQIVADSFGNEEVCLDAEHLQWLITEGFPLRLWTPFNIALLELVGVEVPSA